MSDRFDGGSLTLGGYLLQFVTLFVNFSNRQISTISLLLKTMDIKWKKLIFKVGIWIALEVVFSYVGVDTIADYSEYIFDRNLITVSC
ncbi:MAG: hypothetical protein RLZZ04_2329 [Cyanobacteriota bacterium]|jgi:hypothetical protein